MIEILITTIVILSFTVLYLISPQVISYIKKRKELRERQEVQRIHNIIEAYLKDMIKDE
jgi:hypothetical protein